MNKKLPAILAVLIMLLVGCSDPNEKSSASSSSNEDTTVSDTTEQDLSGPPNSATASTTPVVAKEICDDLYEGVTVVEPGSDIATAASGLSKSTDVARASSATVTAYVDPSSDSQKVETFENSQSADTQTPVFRVIELDESKKWARVLLPVKPNGCTGWVSLEEVDIAPISSPYRIFVDTGNHKLAVYKSGNQIIETDIAVGKGSAKTPLGTFYIEETIKTVKENSPYGPYAFGLSGYSEDLESFAGGDAVIGIHGTNDPSTIGSDVSSGCIRTPNNVVTEMIEIIPRGTPVEIF